MLPTILLEIRFCWIMAMLKAGGNWVEGERFFDHKAEIESLMERVRNGTHTLLTAQRRMGKTSLVRELLRRLGGDETFETIFVDLEAADTPAEAVAEDRLPSEGRVPSDQAAVQECPPTGD